MIRSELLKTRNELLRERLEESKEQIQRVLENLLDENFLVKELQTEILINKTDLGEYYAVIKEEEELVKGLKKDLMQEYVTKLMSILFDEGIWCEEFEYSDTWKIKLKVTL